MRRIITKICRNCRDPFQPKPQARKVQKYCSRKACQQVRRQRKYRRWIADPAHKAAHQERLRLWAQKYPRYWRHYRATHPNYVLEDKYRRAASLKRQRMFRKATDWQQIAVDRLKAIQTSYPPSCSAKPTDLARRVDSVVEYLRWTVEGRLFRKATGIANIGGSAG